MPRHSRSRSPRRQDHHDDRDRDNYRERYRKRSPFPTKRRLNSRSKSPIIRGPSGVKSKNAVNELLLAETVQNEEMVKMMGSDGRIDKDNGQADFRNSESFRKPSGFGNNGGYRTERSGRGGRNFGRGSNQNFGRDRNNFGENRSFRGGRGRPMHGQSDRGRGARRDGPPRREWEEERRTERYKEEDKNKPVLQLINPTHVPRGRNYFEHDNRDAEQEDEPRFTRPRGGRRFEDDRFSRDRERDRRKDGKMYDPRFDFSSSSRNIRDRLSTASGYEKNSAPLGWRNSNFSGANERREKTRTRDDFSHFRQRSSSIEKWTHDKFNEVLHQEEVEGKNIELVEKDSHEEKDGQEELPIEGRVTVVTTENSTRKVTVRE